MTSNRYFFIVLLFLYTLLFIKGYANTTKEFSDVIVPEFPLQVKFANELVDLDRLDMYERFDRELTTLCYMHSSTSLAIKRANRYFPILEPILKEEKVPTDFLYLAVIESTLNPRAVSPAKAVGIWQIMPRTGREYGLEVNNDIDERYHIEKSTRAACKYLKDAYEILKDMGMNLEDRTEVMMAIGNHDEATGTAVSDISAALILADKSDVHRNRVRNRDIVTFDKHDKVNYAVTKTDFIMDREKRKVTLDITIDNTICPVLDYFDIFMERTKMSKYAAKYLNIWFELIINGTKLL